MSSLLTHIDYNKEDKKLNVVFKNGGKYTYLDVPEDKYKELEKAESIGKYFLSNIRGQFESEKEGEKQDE
jgi:hypothetical protein